MTTINKKHTQRNKKKNACRRETLIPDNHRTAESVRHLGVGIDTARYGHHVTFLRDDKELAAPPLPITESRSGYQKLQARLEQLRQQHPTAHIHLRIDAAGQYAAASKAHGGRSRTRQPLNEQGVIDDHD